jgi:hypothetical protein
LDRRHLTTSSTLAKCSPRLLGKCRHTCSNHLSVASQDSSNTQVSRHSVAGRHLAAAAAAAAEDSGAGLDQNLHGTQRSKKRLRSWWTISAGSIHHRALRWRPKCGRIHRMTRRSVFCEVEMAQITLGRCFHSYKRTDWPRKHRCHGCTRRWGRSQRMVYRQTQCFDHILCHKMMHYIVLLPRVSTISQSVCRLSQLTSARRQACSSCSSS